MSDELEQILREVARLRQGAGGPRAPMGPLLRGGAALSGGPTLEPSAAPGDKSRGSFAPHPSPLPPRPSPPATSPSPPAANSSPLDPRPSPLASQLAAVGLHKTYRKGPAEVPVLRGVDLGVREGEFLAIVGQSGSGKSTLLHLLGTLDAPDEGEIHFDGRRIDDLPAPERDVLRNRHFGMIFQFYHLLPELSTLENVLMPLLIGHSAVGFYGRRRELRRAAAELLGIVGLEHRLRHKPRELSGGEMQRAAIARALIARPRLLLADEPTGNLDHDTGRGIIALLRTLNEQQNLTIVMVTHDQAIAQQADRIVRLCGGRIET